MRKSRRDFLKELPVWTMAASAAGAANLYPAQRIPKLHFPPRTRSIGRNLISISRLHRRPDNRQRDKSQPGMTLLEFPAK